MYPQNKTLQSKRLFSLEQSFYFGKRLQNAKAFLATKFVGAVLSLENINHADMNKTRLLALRYKLYFYTRP